LFAYELVSLVIEVAANNALSSFTSLWRTLLPLAHQKRAFCHKETPCKESCLKLQVKNLLLEKYMSNVRHSKKTAGIAPAISVSPLVQVGVIESASDHLEELNPLLRLPPELEPPPLGKLIAEPGTYLITRQQLALIPTPLPTKTYKPISHIKIVEALIETLSFRRIADS